MEAVSSLIFNGLHGVISQLTELFITPGVITSNSSLRLQFEPPKQLQHGVNQNSEFRVANPKIRGVSLMDANIVGMFIRKILKLYIQVCVTNAIMELQQF
jgi:hypothetical protein